MKKVFIVLSSWAYNGDSGHDIIGVFADKENAIKRLKKEVETDKKDSWISDYFENGKLKSEYEGTSDVEYEETDSLFSFNDNFRCDFTEFWIEERNIE